MSAVHNFRESLAVADYQANAPWWEEVYRRAFVDFKAMHRVTEDGWAQRGGIDRQVILSGGRIVRVEEKVRYEDYPDILLEYWSNYERRTEGWASKALAVDYIAYAFVPSQRCYMFPADLLRRVFRENGREWIVAGRERRGGFREVKAKNVGYTTYNVAVPIHILMKKLSESIVVEW